MILFSIIIPTSDRPGHLKKLLESIILNKYHKDKFEVIVIENGKGSYNKEVCSEFHPWLNIKYCYKKIEGFAAAQARNIGISISKGKIVLFFDDDVILEENCIKEHLSHHSRDNMQKIVFGFRINKISDKKINRDLGLIEKDYRMKLNLELSNKGRVWYYAYSCNLSINMSRGKQYFDSNFKTWGNEDQEFAYRLSKKQFEIVICQKCLVYHHSDSNIRNPFLREKYGLDSDYRDFLLSRVYFVQKHWDDLDLRNFIFNDFKYYECRNGKWIKNQLPNPKFSFSKFLKVLNKKNNEKKL